LIGFGFFTWIGRLIYRKLFIERQLKLLIIGEPSTGKTALYKTLSNENVTKDEILSLIPTRHINVSKPQKIPHGKYEIIPELRDMPGSDYSGIWENLFGKRKHAILFVLAAVQDNFFKKVNGAWEKQKFTKSDIDSKYLDVQFGVLKAYLGGISAKSVKRKKPKIIIIFINKFDIFSNLKPSDSSSTQTAKEIRELFKEHIKFAENEAKKAKVKCKIIIGSTLKRWGTQEALETIKNELYNN
jgi:GTPase SAR1 family protein